MKDILDQLTLPEIAPATDEEIVSYLRRSCQIAEIAVAVEQEALILKVCEQLGITVSDEELQAAGDAFRQAQKLLVASETFSWLAQQRISVEDWSEGIRMSLLTRKLKEYLFGEAVDAHYINHREDYKRVALSQILVDDLSKALKIVQSLWEEKASFCALALEYSLGKQSKENGGYMGIRFLSELMPEIAETLKQSKEGEIVGPLQTNLGYHIIKIEKWLPAEMKEIREQVLESLWQIFRHNKLADSSKQRIE